MQELFFLRSFPLHKVENISWGLLHDVCQLLNKSVLFSAAAVGGIIGLCIGFSLLSLIEIIYWFTFRMYNDYVRKDRTADPFD